MTLQCGSGSGSVCKVQCLFYIVWTPDGWRHQNQESQGQLVSNTVKSTQRQGLLWTASIILFILVRVKKYLHFDYHMTFNAFPLNPAAVTVNHNHAYLYGLCIAFEWPQVNPHPKDNSNQSQCLIPVSAVINTATSYRFDMMLCCNKCIYCICV